ncbi:MAG: malate dehydrogenase [Chlamydiales bacterium]|nr:malate dehydrogenase [Chlamydiales bacterium]
MRQSPLRIAVTGSCGQIAYSLLFRIASGAIFGDRPVILHLQDIAGMETKLEGVAMELSDCDFPLVEEVRIGSDLHQAFDKVDIALLVGAKPRSKGMLRKDLLQENGKIFVGQGRALNEAASRDVKVYVVGNPANTNCLVAMNNAPDLPRKNFHALMRLDHNRAKSLLARKADVDSRLVRKVVVWGNHSNTQVPDFTQVEIGDQKATEKIPDIEWHRNEFVQTVQNRGAMVIEKLGRSSAASAANGVIDAVRSLYHPTREDDWFSSAVCSDSNPYGIEENLIFGFPCCSRGDGHYTVVPDLRWDEWIREKIMATEKELIEEREFCKSEGLI